MTLYQASLGTTQITEDQKAAIVARDAEIAQKKTSENDLSVKAEADEVAQGFIAGGAKLWIKGTNARVYLTDDQKLSRKGYKASGKGAVSEDGEKLSNTKTFQITSENIFYDITEKGFYK